MCWVGVGSTKTLWGYLPCSLQQTGSHQHASTSPFVYHPLHAALKFGRGNQSVIGMSSSEGEEFSFRAAVPVEGPVEAWMGGVEAEMRRTLAVIMKEGVFEYAQVRSHGEGACGFVGQHPAQVQYEGL